jgi:hypothetical protein
MYVAWTDLLVAAVMIAFVPDQRWVAGRAVARLKCARHASRGAATWVVG